MSEWEALENECRSCRNCSLHIERTNVVFGIGSREAEVVFIGEGPGRQEDLLGEPFVGRAGKLLDDMLSLINLDRKRIYIANIVKCRPPNHRDPLPEEQNNCFHWLDRQLTLLSPRIIICLGRISAMRLIKQDFRITKEHGLWFKYGESDITAIYHPSALLRDPGKRPETFVDLKAIQKRIKDTCVRTY